MSTGGAATRELAVYTSIPTCRSPKICNSSHLLDGPSGNSTAFAVQRMTGFEVQDTGVRAAVPRIEDSYERSREKE